MGMEPMERRITQMVRPRTMLPARKGRSQLRNCWRRPALTMAMATMSWSMSSGTHGWAAHEPARSPLARRTKARLPPQPGQYPPVHLRNTQSSGPVSPSRVAARLRQVAPNTSGKNSSERLPTVAVEAILVAAATEAAVGAGREAAGKKPVGELAAGVAVGTVTVAA